MQLFLDGKAIEAQCGETLLTLVRRAGLDSLDMAQRPLAAQIGGEVYTLNVDPVHETPADRAQAGSAAGPGPDQAPALWG